MPETITTLTGFEVKPGSNDSGTWTLTVFKDAEGKSFKTFDDDTADTAKALVGKLSVVEFTVKQQNRNGRVFTDNFIDAIRDAAEVSTSTNGASASDVAAVSPAATKILAFKAAVDLLSAVPEQFGEKVGFVDITKVADAIYTWASTAKAADPEPDPEPEPEMVTN